MTLREAVTAGDAGPGAGLQTGSGCRAVSPGCSPCAGSLPGGRAPRGRRAGQLTQTPTPAWCLLGSQECDLGSSLPARASVSSSGAAGVRAETPLPLDDHWMNVCMERPSDPAGHRGDLKITRAHALRAGEDGSSVCVGAWAWLPSTPHTCLLEELAPRQPGAQQRQAMGLLGLLVPRRFSKP